MPPEKPLPNILFNNIILSDETTDINEDAMERYFGSNDDEDENVSRSSRSRVNRPQMKEFRDQMAVQMWEAFQERPWVR